MLLKENSISWIKTKIKEEIMKFIEDLRKINEDEKKWNLKEFYSFRKNEIWSRKNE